MANKYVDITAIMQIIGCVFNQPQLLDYDDKYKFIEYDFPSEFHKIIFGSIYKLHELGAEKISIEAITDFLEDRPKKYGVFHSEKGEEWLTKVSLNAEPSTFDYYYNRMKKMSLLRAYSELAGIDVSDIYDPDNILDVTKKQIQEEFLDNASIPDIIDRIDRKIDNIKSEYSGGTAQDAAQAGDGVYDLLERLRKYPEAGVPLYGKYINTITRGARLKKFYLRSAPTGIGKALPNDTIIPTPTGQRRVGDIREGDLLFGENGKPTKVLKVHPQPEPKQIWNVYFKDGRVTPCCKDHLWEYRYDSHRGYGYRVETTEQIFKRTKTLKNGFKNSEGRGYRFQVKLNQPVEYSEKNYSIDPYVMGAALGDGSLRYNKENKAFAFSSETSELPNKIADLIKCVAEKSSEFNYNYVFKPINNQKHNIWVEELFADYPELWNLKSENKFIPRPYLEGSVEQRYALLQGLMDTDGSIDQNGRTTFSTISPLLRDNVIELCRSLGFVCNYLVDNRPEKYTTGECYTIHIQCKKENKHNLFSLERKVQRAIAYENTNKRNEYKDHLGIVDIIPTDEYAEMTCFTVDNSSHLFLANDFIVTHNTRTMIADACYIGCDQIYEDGKGWVRNGGSEPVVYITTEQELEEIQTMMLAFLSNVDEEHILTQKYQDEDEEARVNKAADILVKSPIYIELLPDFSLQDIEDRIRRNIRDHEVKYVVHDYIHSSLKILEEISQRSGGVKLREDNVLFMLSIRLKDLCNKYGVFILSATQLNGDYVNSSTPDQNLLRGAKSIADKVDIGLVILPVTEEDREKLESITSTGKYDYPQLKISVYKNRRGRYKGVYLWCKANLGTCRVDPMFCTTYSYEFVPIEDTKIEVDYTSAF